MANMAASIFRSVLSSRTAVPNKSGLVTIGLLCRQFSLVRQVQKELDQEKDVSRDLPAVTGFQLNTTGTRAILSKTCQHREIIEVELNTSNSQLPGDDIDEEDDKPFYFSDFNVKFTKPNGNCLSVDCSIEESNDGDYDEGDEEGLTVHSVTVIPNGSSLEQSYTADADLLSEELLDAVHGYLEDRGLNEEFTQELITFYRSFEKKCYVEFLENLQTFAKMTRDN